MGGKSFDTPITCAPVPYLPPFRGHYSFYHNAPNNSMPISLNIQTNTTNLDNVATDATERYMIDAATAGGNAMQEHIAQNATDTGQLLKSYFPPEVLQDGSVVTGFSADYAQAVDTGSRPHWPPIRPLLGWARRVLGDEGAAYAVQRKIASEGTEGIQYAQRGLDAMTAWMNIHSLDEYMSDRL